jgi:acetoin utilization deacetylase AcuC-like enzyme
MNTALFTHPACIEHDPGFGHPECPDRLRSVMQALEHEDFLFLARHEAPQATRDQLLLAHPADHVDRVLAAIPPAGWRDIDADTTVCPASGEAALRAAGAVCAAVDAVFTADSDPEGARNAFCAVRPPGHHAERARAMGFCLFNSVAVGAFHARAAHGIERVAVIDFDVHHGNGTQHIFEKDPSVFYYSIHQHPSFAYPGTGREFEYGSGEGYGYTKNNPVLPGQGDQEYTQLIEEHLLKDFERFKPEFVLVSVGFDGHVDDDMSDINLSTEWYSWIMKTILDMAETYSKGRLISVLEGGYCLKRLPELARNHVEILLNG